MIFPRLHFIKQDQKGFTLVELMAAVIITGLIGVGVATASVEVLNQGERNADYTTASRNTMNAIHWISRDAQMAQTVTTNGTSGFPLTLVWIEWDNSTHQVTYTSADSEIRRSYSLDDGVPSETVVAQYINDAPEMTSCNFTDGVLSLKVTAVGGEGARAVSITKLRKITPRPGI
jgi:prepilin-type N-terminal cleavage/methylation domain-containing protein